MSGLVLYSSVRFSLMSSGQNRWQSIPVATTEESISVAKTMAVYFSSQDR
jgi:hypothetical protein